MKNTSLKSKIRNNQTTIGTWLTIPHFSIVEMLSVSKFDWIAIDMEHNNINSESMIILIQTIQSFDIAALVRVSKNDEVSIKKALDAGADGIIVPSINSVKDIKSCTDFSYYPPKGKRGVGLARAQKYGFEFENYIDWTKENLIIIAQIENQIAIESIDEILNCEEIDSFMIGPYDLSASYGYPGNYNHKIVKEALLKFEKACYKKKLSMGYHVVNPSSEELNVKISKGYKFLAFSTDFLFLSVKANGEMSKLKSI